MWPKDNSTPPAGMFFLVLSAPVDGKTFVMYHGTSREKAILDSGFRHSPDGMLGPGVVSMGSVIIINRKDHTRQETWHNPRYSEVYDITWMPPGHGMSVWDPSRIKILGTIKPRPVQPGYEYDLSYGDTETNMYPWPGDDSTPPAGMFFLGLSAPVDGKTFVMFHGTSREKAILDSGFRHSPDGMLGPGVYLSRDLEKTRCYPIGHLEHDKVVIEVFVNVGREIKRKGQAPLYQWPEDDSTPPAGMFLLGRSVPLYGKTFVMYHGTSRANAAAILASGFHWSKKGLLGPGIYFSKSLKKASYYPVGHPVHDKVVIKVLVNVGRVIAIKRKDHPRRKNWSDPRYGEVYDSAWIPPRSEMVKSSLEINCVRDPNRIKIISIMKPRLAQPGYEYGYRYRYAAQA